MSYGLLAAEKTGVELSIDHENGIYKTGETVKFSVKVPKGEKYTYEMLLDGLKKIDDGKLKEKRGKAKLKYKFTKPGCIMLSVTPAGEKKNKAVSIGAVADPFKIKPSLPEPKGFDKFWDKQKATLAKIPMNPRMTPVDEPQKVNYGSEVECFDVQLDCSGDKPVFGYYVKPKKARKKSLPAVLSLHSAGVRDSSLRGAWIQGKRKQICLDINAHGLPNAKGPKFYQNLIKRGAALNGYQSKGIDKPETFYFLGMYMRIIRAIDFLTSQPEWDGKNLILMGSSQGGGQSMVGAGLDKRVSEIRATVPAFCGFSGTETGRKPGWPGNIAKTKKQKQTVQFFDACNLASRSKAKTTIIVGLIDTICPATGVLAAFNQLKGEKTITILPTRSHGGSRENQIKLLKIKMRV